MSDPKRINADVALVLAMMELNRAIAQVAAGKKNDAGPAPEAVPA